MLGIGKRKASQPPPFACFSKYDLGQFGVSRFAQEVDQFSRYCLMQNCLPEDVMSAINANAELIIYAVINGRFRTHTLPCGRVFKMKQFCIKEVFFK